ncbi:MAG: (d)CMP kinase [Coriobacteriia bacterium]|nr:(d)CMP kinase [Coriobacteriia bacterium]MCL2870326.1 (d)CMP kinase [Coriobacteriia bacterium]
MIIAIDGPAGSGKSSVARAVALRMGFHYLDTGAMYRAVAVAAMRRGIDLNDGVTLREFSKTRKISFAYEEGEVLPSRVYFGDEEMTDYIRSPEVDRAVSPVASCPELRGDMLAKQRMLGSKGNYVVEGRDIGSVVFPNAALKIFLTACVEERARRRSLQNETRGLPSDFDKILRGLKDRDEKDFNREIAPLTIADDAIEIDTTNMSEEEVVQAIVDVATKVRDKVCGPDGGANDDNCRGLPEIGDEYA